MFGKPAAACNAALVVILLMGLPSTSTGAELIFDDDFESASMDGWRGVGSPMRPVPVIDSKITRSGKYAAKAVLDSAASSDIARERVEMRVVSNGKTTTDTVGQEYWYGWSMYLKSPWPVDPKHWELLTQFHCSPDSDDATKRNPTLSFNIKPGTNRFTINNGSDAARTTISADSVSRRHWDGGAVVADQWIDWVVNVKWSYGSDGFLRIWRDGKLLVDYKGPNTFNDAKGPYFKMGIYKANWVTQAPHPDVKLRIAYFDDFKKAGANGSYDLVAPGKTLRPTAPSLVKVN